MEQFADHPTFFLPAETRPQEEVEALRNRVLSWKPLTEALENCPEGIVILNESRQIVYANPAFHQYASNEADLTGQRFGDVISCIHLHRTPGGCGTGFACRHCQMANGMFSALKWTGSQVSGLVHVTTEGPQQIPVRARLESVIVDNYRLLFCRVSAHTGHAVPIANLSAAPHVVADIANLVNSGGPFCPY